MSTACVRKPEWEFAMNVSSYVGSLLVAAALVGSAAAQQGGAPLTTGSIPSAVAAQGHTIGTHTWSHVALAKKTTNEAKEEIEKGFSAVRMALGSQPSSFFRFPALAHPPEMVTYLGERNIGIFSTDMDSFDFKTKKSALVIQNVLAKLKKHGKGI